MGLGLSDMDALDVAYKVDKLISTFSPAYKKLSNSNKFNPLDAISEYQLNNEDFGMISDEEIYNDFNAKAPEYDVHGIKNFPNQGALDKQRHQYAIETGLATLVNGKPRQKNYPPIYAEVDNLSKDGNVNGVTSAAFDDIPRQIMIDKNRNDIDKILTYRHEADHAWDPKSGMYKPRYRNGETRLPSKKREDYLGDKTEVSARLAEMEAIDDILNTSYVREADDRRAEVMNEVRPFFEQYAEEFPDDKRLKLYNKDYSNIRNK